MVWLIPKCKEKSWKAQKVKKSGERLSFCKWWMMMDGVEGDGDENNAEDGG